MKTQHEKEAVSIYDNYKLDSEIKNTEEKYYFIFNERELLLINNQIPLIKDFNEINISENDIKNCLYIGEYYSKDCFAVELNEDFSKETYIESNKDSEFLDLYFVFDENAKVCPKCGFTSFTRICPAIITTIIKKDFDDLDPEGKPTNKVLMAKHSYHKFDRYSLIAGFLEAGESIEEAVKREAMEEVGIEVEDVQYFGSQSWPFPNSLMIGCICKYKSGEIKVDDNEILKAKWFKKDEIEKPPSDISIFSKLINNFKENY